MRSTCQASEHRTSDLERLVEGTNRRYRRIEGSGRRDWGGEVDAHAPSFLRKGVGTALLEQIITEARARGMSRLSLETGSGPAFEPALALYRKRGFVDGEAFSDYVRSHFNQFLHLAL